MNFLEASEKVKGLHEKPTDNEMLQLYALFKQATVGDVNIEQPSFWNMVARAKWNAWNELKSTTSENAKKQYVALVSKLLDCNN